MQGCILWWGHLGLDNSIGPRRVGLIKVDDDSKSRIGMHCLRHVRHDCKQKFDRLSTLVRSALASLILNTRHSLPTGHAMLPRAKECLVQLADLFLRERALTSLSVKSAEVGEAMYLCTMSWQPHDLLSLYFSTPLDDSSTARQSC